VGVRKLQEIEKRSIRTPHCMFYICGFQNDRRSGLVALRCHACHGRTKQTRQCSGDASNQAGKLQCGKWPKHRHPVTVGRT
jgi:hypothetical protein